MKRVSVLWTAAVLLLITFPDLPACGEAVPDNHYRNTSWGSIDFQNNNTQPQPVLMNLYGGEEGELSPCIPRKNASTEVECGASQYARLTGRTVGTWTSPQLKAAIVLESSFTASLWVCSSQGANNVRFNVGFQIDGTEVFSFTTESMNVGSTPVEITGSGSSGYESIFLFPGNTIGVQLTYFSDPVSYFGQGAASTLLVGGTECQSHLGIETWSIFTIVEEPKITGNSATFSATYRDAFSSQYLLADLQLQGHSQAMTVSGPTFSQGTNGSLVSWTWDHKADRGQSGEYKIIISVHYSEDNDFAATKTCTLAFPKGEDEGDGGLVENLGRILDPVYLVLLIAVIVVIVIAIARRRA